MLFRRDNRHDQERGIWVDRGIDSRLDSFEPCEPCTEDLNARDPRGERWHEAESEMCPSCRAELLAHAWAVELFGLPRPFNGDLEGRVITNEEFEEERRQIDPSVFDYFVREEPGL